MAKSAYIHIPFCKKICSYCDFCKVLYNQEFVNMYLDSLKKEIEDNYKGEVLDTLYIGGGTPSSLDIDSLKKLFDIISIFKLNKDYEFTIEFNIEDISVSKLELCRKNRVNRISIGVESFDKENLKYLNRRTDIDIIKNISLVKEYFDNINIDLMYALPTEDINILNKDIDKILELDIPHISCYSLIIEEHTKLNNDKVIPIDEDLDYEMYKLIEDKLKDYNHYEISNYSKKGYESRHNLVYWNNEEYYGFGLGASSYIDGKRINSSKSLTNYLNKIYNYDIEELTIDDKISLELILGFRKTNGINIEEFNKKYNRDIFDLFNIKDLVKEEKLIVLNGYIFVNKKYLYIENEILVNFVI